MDETIRKCFATNSEDYDLAIDAFACNAYVVGFGELSQPNPNNPIDILGRVH